MPLVKKKNMSNVIVYYSADKAERLGVNLGNTVAYIAKNTAIQFIKGGISGALLATLPEINSLDELLSLDGRISPYDTATIEPVRNLLVLKSDAASLVFVDVNINVTQNNIIQETPLVKRTGSVKEFIQAEDYTITINGSLISSGRSAFPYDMLQSLVRLLKTPETLTVANKYLAAFDIENVVVKRADFRQQEQKFMNVLPFTIELKSDENYELEIE